MDNYNNYLASLAAGGGTFLAAKFVLKQLTALGFTFTRRSRFFTIYALSFALALGAYALQVYAGAVVFSQDGIVTACLTAFAASQALWGAFKANKVG